MHAGFFAGKVQSALDSASVDAPSLAVLREAVNLLLVVLHKLKFINTEAFELFFKRGEKTGIALINQPQNHYHTEVRSKHLQRHSKRNTVAQACLIGTYNAV